MDDVFFLWEINVTLFVYFAIGYRYWNDPEVLQKLGQAMGLPSGEAANPAELSGPDETEEDAGDEDESAVHHAASVGDVAVFSRYFLIFLNLVSSECALFASVLSGLEAKQVCWNLEVTPLVFVKPLTHACYYTMK